MYLRYHEPPEGDHDYVVAANNVLWLLVSRSEGYQPGSFWEGLILAACHADTGNLNRLADSFPAIAWAVYKYKEDPDGIAQLREFARS